jgi:adenosylcobinamide-GDP ribazoletransferase
MKNVLYQLAAAVTFFTRLPLWRAMEIPGGSFKKIICFWPLTGWITGGLTALMWMAFSALFPINLAIVLTFGFRILLTGGLHEDGLSDFFDGFGGGKTRADVLRIMKDSQVGSYALLGLIFYYMILFNVMILLPKAIITVVIFAADPCSKMFTGLMMNFLPYARAEEESKAKTLFEKLNYKRMIVMILFGLAPIMLLLDLKLWVVLLFPVCTILFLYFLVKKRLGGYTGDVCGASALLCELSFYLGLVVVALPLLAHWHII